MTPTRAPRVETTLVSFALLTTAVLRPPSAVLFAMLRTVRALPRTTYDLCPTVSVAAVCHLSYIPTWQGVTPPVHIVVSPTQQVNL
jgi:hypothetical protein